MQDIIVRTDFALEALARLALLRAGSEEAAARRAYACLQIRLGLQIAALDGDAGAALEAAGVVRDGLLALGVAPERVEEYFGWASAQA